MELLAREQHQRAEIRRPPNSVILQVVKDVPDGHVVGGKQEFALFRLPDRDCPVANDAAETIGVPAVEGGSEMARSVGLASRSLRRSAISTSRLSRRPSQVRMKPRSRDVRLFLPARFGCRVERTIEQCNGTVHVARLPVWTLLPQGLTEVSPAVSRSTGRPSKFQMPACTLIPISLLAAIPNGVGRLDVRSLVDCSARRLRPRHGP